MIDKIINMNFKDPIVLRKLGWITLFVTIIGLLINGVNFVNNSNLNALRVTINGKNAKQNTLISAKEIHELITDEMNAKIKDIRIKELDVKWMEALMESDSRIRNAEVFIDQLNYLNVEIDLRLPILRVQNKIENEQYYLDQDGEKVRVVANVPIRVPVVTGIIDAYHPDWKKVKAHSLHDIMRLGNKIRKEEFLAALVEQINVKKSGDFQIMPKIGNRMELGSLDNLDEKLENMKALYKKGYKLKNWSIEKYDAVNLEYKDQYVFEPKKKNTNS